jgi:hypothetical protein
MRNLSAQRLFNITPVQTREVKSVTIGSLLQAFVDFVTLWIPVGTAFTFITYLVMAFIGNIGPFDIGVGFFILEVAPLVGFILAIPQTISILMLKAEANRNRAA